MLTRLRRLWSARRPARLLSLVAAPLLMAQCAPSCVPAAGVPGSPQYRDGLLVVDRDIPPGLYVSEGPNCYWERLSGLGGTLGEIIESDFSSGQHVVQVLATDAGFRSVGCGIWVQFGPPTSPRVVGDGDWDVTRQMGANLWVARPIGDCYWERASGYTHRDEVIANAQSNGRQMIVRTLGTDIRFSSNGCGVWTPFNPPVQPVPIFDGDWHVARQMGAGRWQANPAGECYWERANGFTHVTGEIIASGAVASGPVVVDVAPTDARFTSVGCGSWTKIG